MSKIDQLVKTIVKAIDEKDRKKTRALDTVATVSRVDGDTAWVKFAGSDQETPVKQTISVKKGDKVQVRASKGKAWIVGNETAPPTDDTLAKEALKRSDTATRTAKRASDSAIVADVMWYLASALEEGVTVETEGWTKEPQEATVALPYLWCYHEYTRGNGNKFNSDPVIISRYTEGGAGVNSITTYYALGTSTSTAPTTGWATSFTYLSGYYIWRKELISLTDGTTTWSAPVYDGGLTETCSLSYDTAQYIWTESTGSTSVPTGQYVTEVSKSSYKSNPTGGALLLRSAGLYLRYAAKTLVELVSAGLKIYEPTDSTNPVAQFLSSGAVIGKTNGCRVIVDSTGMQFYDANNRTAGSIRSTYVNGYNYIDINATYTRAQDFTAMGDVIVGSSLSVGSSATVTGKLTAGAINNSLFAVSSESVSTDSGTGNRTGTATATKSGYYPLAIAGLSVATGGCYSRGAYLTSQASGSCTVNFRAYNDSGTSQAVNATAYVLWVKTTA